MSAADLGATDERVRLLRSIDRRLALLTIHEQIAAARRSWWRSWLLWIALRGER